MKERIFKICKNNYFLSFILGALSYYLFLSYSQMAGGKYVVLMSDALEGYIPTVKWFCENLLKGENLTYTWSSYLGINFYVNFSTLLIFGVSLPFFLIFHNLDYGIVTVIILVFKAGLASLFFYVFVHKIWNINNINCIAFSVMYALCGFQIAYIPVLLQFSDAVFMLPLILYFLSKYADEGKFKLMCGAYLYLFLNFYYSAYIVGFFSLLYLIFYMFFINRYTLAVILKKLAFFGLLIIITAGITAVVLYPTAYFLMTKYAEDATELSGKLGVYPHDLYNQLFIGQNRGIINPYPYLYCGLPCLLLTPFYFFNKKIHRGERIVFSILLGIMIISCLFRVPYLFWHCFDAPDSFAYRFSFLISFILCVISCRQSEYINDIRKSKLIFLVIFDGLFYLGCMYIQPYFQMDYVYYPEGTYLYLAINIFFMLGYYIWFIIFDRYGKNEKYKKGIILSVVLFICVELVFNGYSAYFKGEGYLPVNYYDSYKLWENTSDEVINDIHNDNSGFYRVDSLHDYISNGALYNNYNGITSFSNIENYEVRKFLGEIGLLVSPRVIDSNGMTDFSRMILGVAYVIDNIDFGDHTGFTLNYDQHATAYKNNTYLSVGFLVDDDIKTFDFSGTNQFANINDLASSMTGENTVIYEVFDGKAEYEELGVEIKKDDDGTERYIMPLDNEDGVGLLCLTIPYDDRQAYVQFDYGNSVVDYGAPYIVDCITDKLYLDERISAAFIKPMTLVNDNYSIGILFNGDVYNNIYAPKDIHFAYYNYDSFLDVFEKLQSGQMDIYDYGNGMIKGHIDVKDEGKILFTSIPYDEGWQIQVNGEKVNPISIIDGAFIGVELSPGSYDLVFTYHVPGLKTGGVISVVSVMALVLLFLVNPRFVVKKRKEKISEEGK